MSEVLVFSLAVKNKKINKILKKIKTADQAKFYRRRFNHLKHVQQGLETRTTDAENSYAHARQAKDEAEKELKVAREELKALQEENEKLKTGILKKNNWRSLSPGLLIFFYFYFPIKNGK